MPPRGGILASKLVLIFTGAFLGAVVLFFGGSLAIIGLSKVGVLKSFMPFDSWMLVSTLAGAVIGGFVGYLIFKKSGLSDPEYYKPF
jgi:membrane protein YqaA with SNARE-associated domain